MDRAFSLWVILIIYLISKCDLGFCNDTFKEDEDAFNEIENFSTQSLHGSLLSMYPSTIASWSVQTGIPISSKSNQVTLFKNDKIEARGQKKNGIKKKMQKYMMPLLIAYKLKFFTLIPVMIGGLILLIGATGLAGFFFALFAAVMGLKSGHDH